MKKFIIGFMLLGAIFVFAPRVRAATIDDLMNQISNLFGLLSDQAHQIADLRAELSAAALRSVTSTTITDTRTVAPTTITTDTRTTTPTTTTVAPVTTTTTSTERTSGSGDSACTATTAPWIKVISPNTGKEVYFPGQQITVTWKSCNIVAKNVGIYLRSEASGGAQYQLSYPTPNDSSQIIALPTITQYYFPPRGQDFKIFISNDQTGGDSSDNLFTINPKTPIPDKIVSPTINPTNPISTERRVCKGGGVSLGWVPCGSVTCASMSSSGGKCKITNDREIVVDNNFGTQRVSFGMRNNTEVKRIQKILFDNGYLSNSSQVSGNFLGATKTAIMQFQKDNNLDVDGVLGSKTLQAIYKSVVGATNPKPAETIYCSDGKQWNVTGYATCLEAYHNKSCLACGSN